jgi:hypothetical protein
MEAQCHTLKTYVGMKKINKNVFELDWGSAQPKMYPSK